MSAILPIVPVNSPSLHSLDGDADLDKKHSSSDGSPSGSETDAQSLASTQLAERRFLRRLDICLLTWGTLSHLIKIMDAQNYKVAFASGMKEQVSLNGGGAAGTARAGDRRLTLSPSLASREHR